MKKKTNIEFGSIKDLSAKNITKGVFFGITIYILLFAATYTKAAYIPLQESIQVREYVESVLAKK